MFKLFDTNGVIIDSYESKKWLRFRWSLTQRISLKDQISAVNMWTFWGHNENMMTIVNKTSNIKPWICMYWHWNKWYQSSDHNMWELVCDKLHDIIYIFPSGNRNVCHCLPSSDRKRVLVTQKHTKILLKCLECLSCMAKLPHVTICLSTYKWNI